MIRRVWSRLRPVFAWLGVFFAKPWWSGVGATATVLVATILFTLAQSEDRARQEAALAHLEIAWIDVVRVEDSCVATGDLRPTEWATAVAIINRGPAMGHAVRLHLVFGGRGIKPLGSPQVRPFNRLPSSPVGVVIERGYWEISLQDGRTFNFGSDVHLDSWLQGDLLVAMQKFEVPAPRSDELIAAGFEWRRLCYKPLLDLAGLVTQDQSAAREFVQVVGADGAGIRLANTWFGAQRLPNLP